MKLKKKVIFHLLARQSDEEETDLPRTGAFQDTRAGQA